MNSLANIIYNYMKNKEINLDDIKKIESKIKELNKDISDLNFENLLNFILDKLHEELNNKKIISKENPKDDNDEKISYDNFKKYYFEQNDSLIQKTFFGVKEANILYNCCQLTKYSFEICKYLSFENASQKNDIQSLVDEWENTFIQGNKYCDMCLIDTDTRIQYKIYNYPEILIIIINNNKNIVKIDIKIKLNKKYEYQLINFISDTKNENNDFNVIYKEENDWRVYQNNNMNKNNIVNDLSKYIPYVIFYGKINKSMTDKISNKSYVTDVFGSSFQSENNNDFLNNFRNNQNNQNNMIPFNNNNFYNFNFNQNYNNLYQNVYDSQNNNNLYQNAYNIQNNNNLYQNAYNIQNNNN
jgi:ubiquitin C-terminal hydrolase